MKKSLWSDSAKMKTFGELKGDIKTDVLVIGGGICGILCAYFLNRAGVNCVLAESGALMRLLKKKQNCPLILRER